MSNALINRQCTTTAGQRQHWVQIVAIRSDPELQQRRRRRFKSCVVRVCVCVRLNKRVLFTRSSTNAPPPPPPNRAILGEFCVKVLCSPDIFVGHRRRRAMSCELSVATHHTRTRSRLCMLTYKHSKHTHTQRLFICDDDRTREKQAPVVASSRA